VCGISNGGGYRCYRGRYTTKETSPWNPGALVSRLVGSLCDLGTMHRLLLSTKGASVAGEVGRADAHLQRDNAEVFPVSGRRILSAERIWYGGGVVNRAGLRVTW